MDRAHADGIIIHYNTDAYTDALIGMLREHCAASLGAIVVVDNGSNPRYSPKDQDIVLVRHEKNLGYAAACNAGIRASSSPYAFVLNSDIEISSDVLTPLIAFMEADQSTGIAGPRLEFPDGRFQLSWGDMPSLRNEFLERRRQRQMRAGEGDAYRQRERDSAHRCEVDWLTGAAMLIRRAAFDKVGGFDEEYFFYFEDIDLCTRMHGAGFRCVYEPGVTLTHYGGGSQSGFRPETVKAYRAGQLRYYMRFCPKISFYLLKIYLSSVFGLLLLTDKQHRAFHSQLLRFIRTYPS